MESKLQQLRTLTLKLLGPFLWLHVPLVTGLAAVGGKSWIAAAALSATAAAVASLTGMSSVSDALKRYVFASCYMVMVSVAVFATPAAYMLDAHMYYFAALAFLTLFCCPATIIVAAGVVALHHLSLNFLLPTAVFPAGADFLRVVVHAVVLIIETVGLVLVTSRMSGAMNEAQTQAEKAARAQAEAESLAAAQRKAAEDQTRRREEMEKFARTFSERMSRIMEGVGGTSDHLRSASSDLVSVSRSTSEQSRTVQHTSKGAADAMAAVSTAATEMEATISEVAARAAVSARSVEGAQSEVDRARGSVRELSEVSEKVASVLELISGIAGQTNLLALNATIEAARAGEEGRGFAVVANEVKTLAAQSEKAAAEIGGYISGMQNAMRETDGAVTRFAETLRMVLDGSASIAAAVNQQQSAVQEISRHLSDVSGQAGTLERAAHDLTGRASETDTRARDLLAASSQLDRDAGEMKDALREFEGVVRNAA